MDLKTFLAPMSPDDRESFAVKCGTTRGHLHNVMYLTKSCSPLLASAIERESGGAVKRQELRPSDWAAVWPELSEAA